ncbi:abortive infection family protein [Methylacidimicrobium tartarophylax]|uniref:Abortive infection protein-like C-terminal domain-containing protein n=1 Tax=Methylacidimicrobium tartarophylax TaxID=1041768 RepID=A0A5E6MPY1_9BACT|nr:abortive infection family protein [Methylacidimicrobium tartarophylax]VVM08109.1 hypothetical protein MAMT_02111 [Methylacidimicrobium tartarophylax]
MYLSQQTLATLAKLMVGECPPGSNERFSPSRTLRQITEFFREFGERDLHPRSGAPSSLVYTKEKLEKFNGTDKMSLIICKALDFWCEDGFNPEHAAYRLNTDLRRDGYEVIIEERYLRMNGNTAETEPYFVVRSLQWAVVDVPSLVKLSEESIIEHIAKAKKKIDTGDSSGAITSAYTLVEEFLKQLLHKTATTFNENEGDIRALYKLLAEPLHLAPKNDSLESCLKAILEGLQREIGGLFEFANKAGDRHAGKYKPAARHARLAVNAAFTLCEFLLESFQHQRVHKQ